MRQAEFIKIGSWWQAMRMIAPATRQELAEAVRELSARQEVVVLEGNSSKQCLGGEVAETEMRLTTRGLNRVLEYEPDDLTISVEAGMLWTELTKVLEEHNQMLPLDPPYAELGTVGGVLAANCSGPRRRLWGTARDLVIGMEYVTLEGKTVQSGGKVVKNVAGLDTGKLMIGSFGTLAVMAVVNFKVIPKPKVTVTLVTQTATAEEAFKRRDELLKSPYAIAAVEILNPAAAKLLGGEGWTLAVQAVGNEAAVKRCEREWKADLVWRGENEGVFWQSVQEFGARWMDTHPEGGVVRMSGTLQQTAQLAGERAPGVFRAASGLAYFHFEEAGEAAEWLERHSQRGWKGVVEAAGVARKKGLKQWPQPGDDFRVMEQVKNLFDPKHLLNPGRLYGRI